MKQALSYAAHFTAYAIPPTADAEYDTNSRQIAWSLFNVTRTLLHLANETRSLSRADWLDFSKIMAERSIINGGSAAPRGLHNELLMTFYPGLNGPRNSAKFQAIMYGQLNSYQASRINYMLSFKDKHLSRVGPSPVVLAGIIQDGLSHAGQVEANYLLWHAELIFEPEKKIVQEICRNPHAGDDKVDLCKLGRAGKLVYPRLVKAFKIQEIIQKIAESRVLLSNDGWDIFQQVPLNWTKLYKGGQNYETSHVKYDPRIAARRNKERPGQLAVYPAKLHDESTDNR